MSPRTIIGIGLFAAGLLLGRMGRPPQIVSEEMTRSKTDIVERPEGTDFASIEEAIRLAPEKVLEDLANDPYLELTDAEIKALADAVDLRKESHRRLLDRVTPPDFSQKLWHAVMRANIGKMPLEQLDALTKNARGKNSYFGLPIAEAIHTSPDRKELLASPWARNYLMIYLDRFSGELPDLKEALALIPSGEPDPSIREELVASWMRARPTAANMDAVFQLASSDRLREAAIRQNAAAIAWQVPDERPAILATVAALPGQQRNWTLCTLALATPHDDPGTMIRVVSQFTSFEYQERITRQWVEKQSDEGKQRFFTELNATTNTPSVQKLRKQFAEQAARSKSEIQ